MPIDHNPGGTSITGDSQEFFRLASLRGAVSLEVAGMKVSRGPVIWKQVKAEYKTPGGKLAVYEWLKAEVARLRPLQEHITHCSDGRVIREVGGEEVQ